MRVTGDYFETILRYIFATESRHCGHFYITVTLNGWLKQIWDSRTIAHESLANSSSSSQTCCTTVERYSRLAQCSHNKMAHIYHQRCSFERRASVTWRPCNSRTMVLQKMINKKQQQHSSNYLSFRLQQWQHLGRKFGTSLMHLNLPISPLQKKSTALIFIMPTFSLKWSSLRWNDLHSL